MVTLIQARRRTVQGQTRPFICRGDDGYWYYVKGVGAGRRSQICELVAGRLAEAFGLTVPSFAVVEVPEGLIQPTLDPELKDLGAGYAFGSQAIQFCQEVTLAHIDQIDEDFKRDVLVFDWWIGNTDRSLTEFGGNPNLLWSHGGAIAIDHNLAFESPFDIQAFRETHVFRDEIHAVFDDIDRRQSYASRIGVAAAKFDSACAEVPEEWWWHSESVPTDFDVDLIRSRLMRFSSPQFWDL